VLKRVPSVALVLGLLLAACSAEPPTAEPVNTGFVPQTVESLDNVGTGMSIALDKDGNPSIAYLGFTQVVEKGEIPPARPATAPALPAVLTATQKDGIFTRGYVVQTDISSTEPTKVPITASSSTGIAVEESGAIDVVWNQFRGVFFAKAPSATTPFGEPISVADVYGSDPAIALDKDGNPWVAFVATDGSGVPAVQVATLDEKGDKFADAETVAQLEKCDLADCTAPSVAVTVAGDQLVIAYTDPATGSAEAATKVGDSWVSHPIDRQANAQGISIAATPDGTLLVAYLVPNAVRLGTSPDGTTWSVSRAAAFDSEERQGQGGGTAIGTGKGIVYLAYTSPGGGPLELASHQGDDPFKTLPTAGTVSGLYPALGVSADGKANLAWYDSEAQDAMLGLAPSELGGYAAPAPSTAAPTQGGGGAPGPGCPKNEVEVVAPVGAVGLGFQPNEVDAPSGDFTLCFNNEDTTTHNLAVYTNEQATELLAGDTPFTGPKTDSFKVSGLDAGSYFFRCDVHPTQMTGTLTVK